MTVNNRQREVPGRVRVTGARGPSHVAHMRGGPELVDRSATAKDREPASRLWTLSEELTDVRSPV
jgi:hypothetical protein